MAQETARNLATGAELDAAQRWLAEQPEILVG